jgi:RNAse (barnase) inhibitor barstar
MKQCVLEGSRLSDAAAVYRVLAEAFQFPGYFGNNPDALWDALGDYSGEPVAITWRDATRSADVLGPGFAQIMAVLQRAASEGRLTLEIA